MTVFQNMVKKAQIPMDKSVVPMIWVKMAFFETVPRLFLK
jgi:hypothetical protein